MNLAVCVPISWDFVPTPFLISFTGLFRPAELKAMREQGITRYFHLFNRAFPLDLNRNQMVEKALELSADWLLFLDADMTFPAGLVSRLIAAAKQSQAHLVSACYFKREPPHPCVSGRLENPEDPQLITPLNSQLTTHNSSLIECDVIGLGAALIHHSVFTKVPCPWFEYEVYQKTGERVVTEDVPFCRKAKALGETILTDTRLLCGHVRQVEVGEEDWLKCGQQMNADGDGGLANKNHHGDTETPREKI